MEMTILNQKVEEIEIVYRNKVKMSERIKINRSTDCYELILKLWNNQIDLYESFYILLLNRANKVLGYRCISQGGVSGTVVDPKAIFQAALMANASSIVLFHNHPSQCLTPSEADIRITAKIKNSGEMLEIHVLDHLIVTTEGFYSFADENML